MEILYREGIFCIILLFRYDDEFNDLKNNVVKRLSIVVSIF